MTIADVREKCKSLVAKAPRDALILTILVLSAVASFGLGYLAGLDASRASDASLHAPLLDAPSTAEQVVASKSGTKYYFPSCAGAGRINDANKVWFASPDAARAAGYSLAANCSEK